MIHNERINRQNPGEVLTRVRMLFTISVITRIRDLPNDRFGLVYTDTKQLHQIHEDVVNIIQSFELLTALINAVPDQLYLDNDQGGTQFSAPRYSVSKQFEFSSTVLNPIHLNGRFFLANTPSVSPGKTTTKASTKIAGYRTYTTFVSPQLTDNFPSASCRNITLIDPPTP